MKVKFGDYHQPVGIGARVQCVVPASVFNFAASVPHGGNITSGVIVLGGYYSFAFGCKLTQNGSISLQRYLDEDGTIPVGLPITQDLTANAGGTAAFGDGLPCQSVVVTINNTGGSDGTMSSVIALLQA